MTEYTVGDVVAALGYDPVTVVKMLNDAGRLPPLDENTPILRAPVSRDVLVALWVSQAEMREAEKLAALLARPDSKPEPGASRRRRR